MGKSFVEPPLEGLWWADDMNDFISGNRDKLKWRLMIVTADWVDEDMFDEAVARASERARGVAEQSETRAVHRRHERADHARRPQ
jgi:hypothetical protein